MWTQTSKIGTSGLGEQIFFGGRGSVGFALAAAGDPQIWSNLNAAQQAWVMASLAQLNAMITKTNPGSLCPGWVPPSGASGITSATGCFQAWFNSVYPPGNAVKQLRTDGAFDQDTLSGLQLIASLHPTDFTTPYPAGLSTAAMVGIAAAGATVIGGIAYVVMGKKGKRKSRRR